MLKHSRGQALIESVFFLPILLLALFAVIYLSQFGNINQLVQIAIRYGSLAQWVSGTPPVYSAEAIYLSGTQPPSVNCPSPAPGVLYNAAPFPGPTNAPYWQPTTIVDSPTCNQSVVKLQGAQFLMSRYLVSGTSTIAATVSIPPYLASFGLGSTASATQNWVHAAWPAAVLACIKDANSGVQDMLTNMETVTLPTGWTTSSGC